MADISAAASPRRSLGLLLPVSRDDRFSDDRRSNRNNLKRAVLGDDPRVNFPICLQSGAATCSEGFVKCFLRVPQAIVGLYCSCNAAQASKGNFQKTFYRTSHPRLYLNQFLVTKAILTGSKAPIFARYLNTIR